MQLQALTATKSEKKTLTLHHTYRIVQHCRSLGLILGHNSGMHALAFGVESRRIRFRVRINLSRGGRRRNLGGYNI